MSDIRVIAPTKQEQRKIRVAAYCRVSSDSSDQLASYRKQVEYYTALIDANPDWQPAGIYADEGLTGTRSDSRDDFQRMLRDCAKGRIDRILVKSISRFARNTRDCLAAVRQLKAMGVGVHFEKENIDTALLSSEMLLCLYSAGAQQESESISQNMRWSYKRRMERGEFITCSAPFGYRLNGRHLVIEEAEAEIIRRVFREYLSGRCRREIAADLTSEGIAKKTGASTWRPSDITLLLQNEKCAGNAIVQKTYSTGTLPFRTIRNRGERQRYHIQGSHPAIITQEEYERSRALAERRTVMKSENSLHTFTKRITCAHCGSALKHRLQNGKVTWICYRHYQDKALCPLPPIPEPDIEAAFVRLWNKLLQYRESILTPLLAGLQELRLRSVSDPCKLEELNRQISDLTEQNHVLSQIRAKGYLDDALYTQQTGELNVRLEELRFQRRVLLRQDEGDSVLAGIQSLAELMMEAQPLDAFDAEAFRSVAENIITDNDKLRFRLLGGLELVEFLAEGGAQSEAETHPIRLSDGKRRNHTA